MAYVRIFSQPLSQIAQGITSLQQASAAMGRVFEFLAEEEMEDESHKERQLIDMKGQVVFDRVSFGYTPERTIIHDFSATAHAGQKVAIVGPTGAGKTTIVNLLMKFYEIDKGSIRIDDVDTKRDEAFGSTRCLFQWSCRILGSLKVLSEIISSITKRGLVMSV